MRSSLFLLLSLLLVDCSQEPETEYIQILDKIPKHIQEVENLTIFPGDSEPHYSIELITQQTYGETGEPYLTQVAGSAVDDQGRIIILNSNTNYEHSLYVYNADGIYHNQIGDRGRGPGEYGIIFDIKANSGKVYIDDVTNQRINIYNTDDYSFERSMLSEHLAIRDHEAVQGMKLGLIMPREDGNYLVSFSQRRTDTFWSKVKYLLMDEAGNELQFEPLEFRSSPNAQGKMGGLMPIPFIGSTIKYLSDEDALYSVWNHDFLIRKYDNNGVYQSAIYYPVTGSPFDLSFHTPTPFFDASDVMRAIDMHDEELPESNPVLDNLMVDDENRIWAAVPMDGQRKNYEWWILAPSGELLAKLQRPRDKTIFDIKNGYLYAKEIDEDTGAEFVVKYRIELADSK